VGGGLAVFLRAGAAAVLLVLGLLIRISDEEMGWLV